MLLNRGLQVFGMNIHPRRRHNHFALATQKLQLAGAFLLRNVARRQPLALARVQASARPRCSRDRRAPHQHFAIRPQLYLASRQRFADGPLGHVERVVQRNQRRGLRHSVPLHQHKTKGVPELLQRTRQGSTT